MLRMKLWRSIYIPYKWKVPEQCVHASWRGVWPPPEPQRQAFPPLSDLGELKAVARILRALHTPHYRQHPLDEDMFLDVGEALARASALAHRWEPGWYTGDFFFSAGRWSGEACVTVALVTYSCSLGSFEHIVALAARALVADKDAISASLALAKSRRGGRLGPMGLGTQNWCQQLLDIAFMLHWRRMLAELAGRFSIYWFADSSPQRGYDWLNTSYILGI